MKCRNYCKRLRVEAKVYRAMGSDGEDLYDDVERCRAMVEERNNKGIKRDDQKRCKSDDVAVKGVPFSRDGR